MSKFANLVISAAQYGLAAGAAAQGTKGAAKGASAAGLFFMLLGLSFFLCMDYNSRFGGSARISTRRPSSNSSWRRSS